jgi:hypothetical protein
MARVIFLLEEPSMKSFLQEFLPRLMPDWQHERDFLCVPHRGKSDLDRSIPNKLKAWREPGVRFVILRDNDGADCLSVKSRLRAMAVATDRVVLIRLVCQELEGWYLGDPEALAAAYPEAAIRPETLTRAFRDPDARIKPSRELRRWIPMFQKNDGARRMGQLVSADGNRSHSFRVFVSGLRSLINPAAV